MYVRCIRDHLLIAFVQLSEIQELYFTLVHNKIIVFGWCYFFVISLSNQLLYTLILWHEDGLFKLLRLHAMHLILAISRESQNYIVNRTLTKPEKSQSAAYFSSKAYRPHLSATKTENFENDALQLNPRNSKNARFAL